MSAAPILKSLETDAASLLQLEDLSPESPAAIYLSGSLVEGFGNQCSDVDIFVVGALKPSGQTVIKKSKFSIAIHFLGKRRVDFEYWPEDVMRELADKLAHIDVRKDFVAEKLDPVEELFIHRLKIGIPLARPERLQELRSHFNFELFTRYLAQQSIHRIDGALEDLYGMIDDLDTDVALMRARDLVGLACDAYCHRLGNTNPLPKWRPKVLAALAGRERVDEVAAMFWRLQFPEGNLLRRDMPAARAYLMECISFANQIVDWLQQ